MKHYTIREFLVIALNTISFVLAIGSFIEDRANIYLVYSHINLVLVAVCICVYGEKENKN